MSSTVNLTRRRYRCRRVTAAESRRLPWLERRGFIFVLIAAPYHVRYTKHNGLQRKASTARYASETAARSWCAKRGVEMP